MFPAPLNVDPTALLLFQRLADPENMPVGMAHVHLAHVPWVIRWRPRHFQTLFDAVPVFGVHVIHPHRHPYTLVCGLVAFRAERHPVVALAASTLPVFAQEDLALTGADATEGRGSPQSQDFFHPSFSNHAKLSTMLETLRIGFSRLARIARFYPIWWATEDVINPSR